MSLVTYVEVRAAFARAFRTTSREPSLSLTDYTVAVEEFDADWPAYLHFGCSETLVQLAGENAEKYGLRGYDALHLTSALALQSAQSDEVRFSTWDKSLAGAAVAAGLSLAHEVTS
jgi:predicted nucleic acid-binding protein